MTRLWLLLTAALLLASLLVPSVASALTYRPSEWAGWWRTATRSGLVDRICSLGTSPMGFRFGGSFADDQAAALHRRGDAPKPASRTCISSACPPTSTRSIGPDVQVAGGRSPPPPSAASQARRRHGRHAASSSTSGLGTKAEFDAAGRRHRQDRAGRLRLELLVARTGPSTRPTFRGAKAVVFTTSPVDLSYYLVPESYGSNDSEASWSIPGIYVNRVTGDWLKETARRGPFGHRAQPRRR